VLEYAAEMKRRDLRIPFECIARADRLDARMAETLAALGCYRVWIGSESGSQRILNAMQRGVTGTLRTLRTLPVTSRHICDTVPGKESAMLHWLVRLWHRLYTVLHRPSPPEPYRPSNLHGRHP
jgi:hypothetical protein